MNRFDDFYMNIAKSAAQLSYAKRMKVGAVAVHGNSILDFGYNGTLPGTSNECEVEIDGKLVTHDGVLHAEENLLIKMAKSTRSTVGATMYMTLSPCMKCSRMIAAAGFVRLVYNDIYRDTSGIDLLKNYGLTVEKYDD